MKLEVTWIKYPDGKWCALESLNLEDVHFNGLEGVYVIFQGGGSWIRVGQGDIRARLGDHRKNPEITKYGKDKTLFATWAKVDQKYRDGVERYLADTLKPLVGDRFPDVPSIEVNIPA